MEADPIQKPINKFFKTLIPLLKNKYTLVILFFIVWILFFDNNNLVDRYRNMKQLNKLKKEKYYYEEKIKADRQRTRELMTDDDNLEKFAREQYLMKKPNEDIFLIVED